MQKVRIGIAGLGRLGITHARNIAFHTVGGELTALCRRNPQALKAAGEELGVLDLYTDFDEMLEQAEMDAVVIVTASDCHARQAIQALRAGKHVFCEKPLGISAEECKQVEQEALARPHQVFFPGFMRRFDPSYRYAREKIDAGLIGEPYLVKGFGADPMSTIQECIEYGGKGSGGLFMDLGIHDMDLARWFLGEDPTGVFAQGGSFKYPVFAQRGDAEAGIASYTFASGKMAFLHAGRAAPHGYHVETEIVGTEGIIRISPVPNKNHAMLYVQQGVLTECYENFPQRFEEAYRLELQAFIDCVQSRRQPGVTVTDGRKAAQIAVATTRSFREKRYIKITY